jgi:hypothetical protein
MKTKQKTTLYPVQAAQLTAKLSTFRYNLGVLYTVQPAFISPLSLYSVLAA